MDEKWKEKLKEKQIPPIECFFTKISNMKCSKNDQEYTDYIFKDFKLSEITDYNNIYVKTDVLLLADIFADYGKRSYEIYQLDPIYCVSSPGFSNRAMLKCTSAEIKLIIDNNMHLIIEKGSRGGRCEPLLLKAEANNKYVNKNFDKNKDTEKYLVSLDVNSLYQTAMTDKLPNGSFKYVDDISTFTTEYILSLNENGDYYYTFVANFDYPKKLHTEHN